MRSKNNKTCRSISTGWRRGLLAVALVLFFSSDPASAFAQTSPIDDTVLWRSVCSNVQWAQGSWGALMFILAGIFAVVASAIGNYKMAINTIVIGAGIYCIFPILTLFYGAPDDCLEFDGEIAPSGSYSASGGSSGSGNSGPPAAARPGPNNSETNPCPNPTPCAFNPKMNCGC